MRERRRRRKRKRNDVSWLVPFHILDYPLLVYGMLVFFKYMSWSGFAFLIFGYVASSAVQSLVSHVTNISILKRLETDLSLFEHYSYQCHALNEFLPDSVVRLLGSERLGLGLLNQPIGYIYSFARKEVGRGRRLRVGMSTYPVEIIPWYIFVPDAPSKFTAFQRFQLLHEIGHSMLYHRIVEERRLGSLAQAFLFLCVFQLTSSASLLTLIGACLCLGSWLVLAAIQKTPSIDYEKIADDFGFRFLPEKDRQEAMAHHRITLETALYNADAKERLRELNEMIFPENLEIDQDHSLRIALHDYNRKAKSLAWPKWYAYSLLLASLLLAVSAAQPSTNASLAIIFVFFFLLYVVLFFIIRSSVEKIRCSVENALTSEG